MRDFDVSSLPERTGDVHIPDGTTKIVKYDNNSKHRIRSLHIPQSVREIGQTAFLNVAIHGELMFAPCSRLETIGAYAFSDSIKQHQDIVFPRSVRRFEASCFRNCNFTSVEITNEKAIVGFEAFTHCARLTEIIFTDIPKISNKGYNRQIYGWTFSHCGALTRIDATGVKSVGGCAFHGTERDPVITHAKFVHCINFDYRAFYSKEIELLELGARDIHFAPQDFNEDQITRVSYNLFYSQDSDN